MTGEVISLPDSASTWWLRKMPIAMVPFIQLTRLDRPIGWWLLLLPCWQSLLLGAIATQTWPPLKYFVLFWVGAVAMRGAGSTYNDYVDRDLDAQVARTAGRPFASGKVSLKAGKIFIGLQLLISAGVLFLLPYAVWILALTSLIPVLLYPFMKRVTSWPQLMLGIAFSYGALIGWLTLVGSLSWAPCLLYIGTILWTMGYDTIYALQDVKDDAICGIGSTARMFGVRVRGAVALLYIGALFAIGAAIYLAGGGMFTYIGLMAFALHLGWQIWRVAPDMSGDLALKVFRSNKLAGLLLCMGIVGDIWVIV